MNKEIPPINGDYDKDSLASIRVDLYRVSKFLLDNFSKDLPHLKDCCDSLFFAEIALNQILGTYKIDDVEAILKQDSANGF